MENSDLIAYCGLYCGDCPMHRGEIADLARDLRRKLRDESFSKVAHGLSSIFKEFQHYDECYQVLGGMVRMRCKRTCRAGGGPPSCKMRNCCQKKGIKGCWECDEFENCEKLRLLETVHEDAHLKNLRNLKKRGVDQFLVGRKHW